ncbi:electron transfer flavoprotein beta subunit lysine methyltransferase isoform X2 [Psammomys obesus]|uniref:electron transfer flavoprotein beta subunit lysine methyltransferase isoform X2 n=1 Tax=Psammomys obesus TaxID=48139 RepID=UPI002453235D|nr:electron transfer flavoprotein beta subunit lysine methyltransferase isoform X2 [Psammomys obesus]
MAFSLGWKAPRGQWSFLQAVSRGFPLFPWRTVGNGLNPQMKAYLEENTEVTSSGSLTPEIQLRLLTPRCKFWWERAELWPYSDPYWAIYWPGGQALSRYLLDNPDVVRGKSVLDLGSGCGATAIAAKMSGASKVLANDIDPTAVGSCCFFCCCWVAGLLVAGILTMKTGLSPRNSMYLISRKEARELYKMVSQGHHARAPLSHYRRSHNTFTCMPFMTA